MSQDNGSKAGATIIGAGRVLKPQRSHDFRCENCPRWEPVPDLPGGNAGICRVPIPVNTVIGLGEGIDRRPLPLTHPIRQLTEKNDVCALHPKLLHPELVEIAVKIWQGIHGNLTWNRDRGFNRAPSLAEAMKFAPESGFGDDKPPEYPKDAQPSLTGGDLRPAPQPRAPLWSRLWERFTGRG